MLDPLFDQPFHSEMVLKILSRTLHVDSAHLVQFNFIRKNIIMALLTRDRDGKRIFGEWSDIDTIYLRSNSIIHELMKVG